MAVSFGYGRRRHAVVALIDHVLGGGMKDSHVTGDAPRLLAQTRGLAREDGPTLVRARVAALPE